MNVCQRGYGIEIRPQYKKGLFLKNLRWGKGLFHLGITGKLLGIVLPLVVLPCLVTGGLGYFASEEIVTRLLNQSQINRVREIAEEIDQIFNASRADLKMISHLPVLRDYYYNRFYALESEAEINRKEAERFFKDVARKSPLYYRISYVDSKDKLVACVQEGRIVPPWDLRNDLTLISKKQHFVPNDTVVSPAFNLKPEGRLVVHMAQPLFDRWNELAGIVQIDLDINELGRRVLSRRVGVNGYAFVLDNAGRVLIHPEPVHMGRMISQVGEPSLEAMFREMVEQGQGMLPYYYRGDRIAAFTRVRDTGWTIAVTLPVAEFKAHVTVIKRQVLQIIIVAASLALAAGIFFSWHFLRPIKKLAGATKVISEGRLPEKIHFDSNDELGMLTRSFNQMVKNLRRIQSELVKSEKLVSVGRLASGVAHEVRNPLNTMNVTLGLLKRRVAGNKEVMALAETISAEISQLDHFLSDFLSYSRQPPPKSTPTNVNEMAEDILSGYSARALESHITLKSRLDQSLPLFPLDPFQVERAIVNIVVNAIESMPDGGTLIIKTKWRPPPNGKSGEGFLEFSIADTGKGLSSEELQSVLDPFYTTKELGTGLGLSLSQSIIESHGGHIRIRSEPGWGTTVTIMLPRLAVRVSGGVDHEQV